MPLYEYQCTQCGTRFERIQKFSDPPQSACASCGGTAERLLSAPAIQFKGSGWYVTDYARKTAPESADKGEKKGAAEGKEASKGEAKTEPKSGTKTPTEKAKTATDSSD